MDWKQTSIFAAVVLFCIYIGGHIVTHIMFGLFMLAGIVGLAENIPFIKWIVYKSNNILDIGIFVLAGLATFTVGVTITGAVTVAGLGYTFVYAPYVRNQLKLMAEEKAELKAKKNAITRSNRELRGTVNSDRDSSGMLF